ncbi:MAG: hypothetical protein HZB27_01200 [Meiothermus silvanus]|nr:hypothetical protein [Allomeiothermus silvanus]
MNQEQKVMQDALLTTDELRALAGPHRLGRDLALRLMRVHGKRIGRRWLISRRTAEKLLGLTEDL